jgi:hypothetical protein
MPHSSIAADGVIMCWRDTSFSCDVRAQVRSHGLGGVQARHYDRHSYFAEKKQALQKWLKHLRKLQSIQPSKAGSPASGVWDQLALEVPR